MKNDDFQEGKMVADGRFLGGDPTKNCNFQRRKVGLLWNKNFQDFHGGDVDEMIDFERVKSLDL